MQVVRHVGPLILVAVVAGCAPAEPPPEPRPETITLMLLSPERLQGPIAARTTAFTRQTGIKVDIKAVPNPSDLFAASQNPNHGLDVIIALNIWVADFFNTGFVQPLDDYINADINDSELAWSDIPQGVRNKNSWGDRVFSQICDNDNMFLIYRKDVLSDPANRDAFLAEKKYPLPNPPQTIDELIDVATFFNDKDWDNDGIKERSFVISRRTPDQLMYWYALSFTTPYTVMPASVADGYHLPHGLFMFKPDMTPLVSTPGFKLGVSKWLTLARLSDPNAGRQDVIDQIVKGEALMAVDWGDTGPASLAGNSVVRGKLGFALAPGTRSYYDWKAPQPAMVDTSEINYAPLNQANGFAFYMTSTSQHKAAVWRFIKYMNSKDVSMAIVSDSRGGYQPWRTSHSNNLDNWVQAGWTKGDAENYVTTILASTNHPNASLDLRIPGAFSYGAVIEQHLAKLLNTANADSTAIDAEMDACARDLDKVTDDNIREAQKAAYERHLGLHK